jgi:streptogramin lyase
MVRLQTVRALLTAAALILPPTVQADEAKPGLPALQRPFADLTPSAKVTLGKTADWVQLTPGAVWIGSTGPEALHHLDRKSGKLVASIALPGEACAGLTAGFGGIWVPLCGDHPALAQIDIKGNRLSKVLPIASAGAEGGIAASDDSIWMATDAEGSLARINPKTGKIRQIVKLTAGSFNPLFSDGIIWVTSIEHDLLTAVDAKSGRVIGTTPVGPKPRFLTAGAGAIWTLNQGDGSVTRVDIKSRKRIADIPLGLPGPGGDIAYGDGKVWVTMMEFPLTEIDPTANQPVAQWVGPGGDSLKVDGKRIWLTDYKAGSVSLLLP